MPPKRGPVNTQPSRLTNISPPNSEVTKIENEFIKNLSGITGGLASLSLTSSFPTRPGHGSTGTAFNVYSNYFEIKLKDPKTGIAFYRYNVEVSAEGKAPKASKVKIKRLIILLLENERFHGALTDYRSTLLSRSEIQGIPADIVIPFRVEGEATPSVTPVMYRIKVQATGTVQVSEYADTLKSADPKQQPYPQRNEVFQALNTVFGHFPQQRSDLVTVGQNKHFMIKPRPDFMQLGGGMDALRGFFKSVRPATNRLLLNVNVSHSVFFSPLPLPELYWALEVSKFPRQVEKKLKLVRFNRVHLKEKLNPEKLFPATFWGFASPNDGQGEPNPPQVKCWGAGPKDVKFFLNVAPAAKGTAGKARKSAASSSDHYISVWDYFIRNYPGLKMDSSHPVINVGNRQNPRYLPAEVCEVIAGQPVGSKLQSAQTTNMINFACRTPDLNAASISHAGRDVLGLNEGRSAGLEKLGLQVERDLITVQARLLMPPPIQYAPTSQNQPKKVYPANGGWNMIGSKFNKSTAIRDWTYVEIVNGKSYWKDPTALSKLVQGMVAHMRDKTGVKMTKDPTVAPDVIRVEKGAENQNNQQIEVCFRRYYSQRPKSPDHLFLLIVLPFYDASIYSTVKRLADTKAGIHTVCVVAEKLSKGQMQYWGNVALKFNLKAGGTNHALDSSKLGIISEGKTMVVGIDVTHPSPQSTGSAPSVAGIVASVDKTLGQWPASLSVQESRKEMVSALKDLFKSRLQVWMNRNSKQLPENIIIYRDGVSEGQYQTVLEEELPLIRQACTEMYPAKVKPALSIIIVGKRHHTRFYPTNEADMDAKNGGNCKPGTVVDRGVTEVRFWHFYLQAHAAIKGTARPAHYYVILDEIFRYKKGGKAPADALEELTHNMCHLFGRATRAVSICPPAYYADLVCERARCYLSRLFDNSDSGSATAPSNPAATQADLNARQADVILHASLKDTMFYI